MSVCKLPHPKTIARIIRQFPGMTLIDGDAIFIMGTAREGTRISLAVPMAIDQGITELQSLNVISDIYQKFLACGVEFS